ncbi:hypothetical protein RPB_1984 [Rhodopseudomonas palustris HaA2]|uniref:Uncharacterized protein n=1 Tax=Rhodopseudomonas palustris (strain HaA2) TaxID=316058 RepID=Q2IYL8_RHOP2|nr:hypothetical protein [Rhodopseudomonas palustris]ABD06692.1 hypothetical protein RPB_1984 [Rhodopseudomonas palustris HaA2]
MTASRIAARLTLLIAVVAVVLPTQVGAQSMFGARPIAGPSDVVQVRDGCGPGMRFSERRQACVEDFDRAPPPRYYEERRYVPPPPPPRRYVDCGPGKRFSERRQACVWIDGARQSDDGAAAAAIAGGLLGAAIGAAAASGNRGGDRDVRRGPPPRGAGPAPQAVRTAPAARPAQKAAPAATRPAAPAVGRIGG